MTETTHEDLETVTDESAPSSFTTESTGEEAIGSGQSAIAPGYGTVNGRTLEDYFPNKVHQQEVNDPFKVLDLQGRFDVVARITGGGPSGQAGALRLGVSRALNEIDQDANRATLKKAGFLTRDARVIARKKAGLKKARKASQFSKR